MQMRIEFKGHQGVYNDELFFLTAHEKKNMKFKKKQAFIVRNYSENIRDKIH